jgi:SAM-dependent methyltransferase
MWDLEAATYDEVPDHGLRDEHVRHAWRALLRSVLPEPPALVLDVGCGTGSLTTLLAADGHRTAGVDASPEMLRLARAKAGPVADRVLLCRGDAARPPFAEDTFDVVLCRHVLWSLARPGQVLLRWRQLLRPGGSLVLVEGRWTTGAGLRGEEARALLSSGPPSAITFVELDDPALWGREIHDERYLISSRA